MPEPFSLAVGIISVIRAADSIVNSLNSIRAALADLLALINEISDLRVVLQDVDQYSKDDLQADLGPHAQQLRHLCALVDQAKSHLSKLDSRTNTTFIQSANGHNSVSRMKWFKAQDTITALRCRLRETRLNIAIQLAVINSAQQFHTGLVVDEVSLTSYRI
ncbi:MAG: hypothetical protein MMC33_008279 [Icmadophila ericetorum]|nr:hypothetical protein [Icmadophila ericetorum]